MECLVQGGVLMDLIGSMTTGSRPSLNFFLVLIEKQIIRLFNNIIASTQIPRALLEDLRLVKGRTNLLGAIQIGGSFRVLSKYILGIQPVLADFFF